jgi:hypothetical protein
MPIVGDRQGQQGHQAGAAVSIWWSKGSEFYGIDRYLVIVYYPHRY